MSQENQQQGTQTGQTQQGTSSQQSQTQQGAGGQGGEGQSGGQGQQQQGQQQSQQTPPPSGVTTEQMSEMIKTAVGETAQQFNRPQETPEQQVARFEKAFNVYKYDSEKLKRLGYSDEQIESIVPVYEDMRDGLVKQAVTMANYQIGLLREELTKQFQPALTVAQKQMETELKAEFIEKHNDLKGYEPLLELIKNRLVAEKRQFKNKEELFKTIAEEARAAKGQFIAPNGTGQQGSGQQQQTQQQQQSHRMSTVTAGGQGGVGGSAGGSGDGKPGWLQALS